MAYFATVSIGRRASRTLFRFGLLGFLITLGIGIGTRGALALPSFARQTGQQCAACHDGFPELTPYGRLFKLNGYTFSGGQSDYPPIAAMLIGSFTHTDSGQPGGAAPHYAANDNADFQTGSLFYGGAIAPHVGAFAQVTYDNNARHFGWDNLDVRYANTGTLGGGEVIYGISLNNNPTVTDVWNSTPAWSYPFLTSELAPSVGAATLIEGGLAQQVLGLNTYTFWNRLVYAEIGGYVTPTRDVDTTLGADPSVSSLKGLAPYWRFAIEPSWGRNTWEFGTFGLAASLNPGRVTGFGTDHTVDIGFDTQYQFLADHDSYSLQASYITENQSLTASAAQGIAANTRNQLRSFHVKGTYFYDQTYGGTIGYFNINGSGDPLLYAPGPITGFAANRPNSTGWIAELDYIPFNYGGPSPWPWLNVKLGLQYIYYTDFNGAASNYDGSGRNASDNNTLFLFAWLAF